MIPRRVNWRRLRGRGGAFLRFLGVVVSYGMGGKRGALREFQEYYLFS